MASCKSKNGFRSLIRLFLVLAVVFAAQSSFAETDEEIIERFRTGKNHYQSLGLVENGYPKVNANANEILAAIRRVEEAIGRVQPQDAASLVGKLPTIQNMFLTPSLRAPYDRQVKKLIAESRARREKQIREQRRIEIQANLMKRNFYERLGLSANPETPHTQEVINARIAEIQKLMAPVIGTDAEKRNPVQSQLFSHLQETYTALGTVERRKVYDASLRPARGASKKPKQAAQPPQFVKVPVRVKISNGEGGVVDAVITYQANKPKEATISYVAPSALVGDMGANQQAARISQVFDLSLIKPLLGLSVGSQLTAIDANGQFHERTTVEGRPNILIDFTNERPRAFAQVTEGGPLHDVANIQRAEAVDPSKPFAEQRYVTRYNNRDVPIVVLEVGPEMATVVRASDIGRRGTRPVQSYKIPLDGIITATDRHYAHLLNRSRVTSPMREGRDSLAIFRSEQLVIPTHAQLGSVEEGSHQAAMLENRRQAGRHTTSPRNGLVWCWRAGLSLVGGR